MEGKVSLQDLAQSLASKRNIQRKEAEAFLKAFFETISDGILKDKIAKIKGLGTFKMIEVQDRESVNVNTGERIIIPGHSKISFTPDTELKDQVNKPFAFFQTVIINEGTSIEDMEKFEEPSSVVSLVEQETSEALVIPEVQEVQEVQVVQEVQEVQVVQEVQEVQGESEKNILSTVNSQLSTAEEPRWWHISPAMLALLFAFFWIVLLIGYFIGSNNWGNICEFFNKSDQEPIVEIDTVYIEKTVEPDSLYLQSLEDSLRKIIQEESKIKKEQQSTTVNQPGKTIQKPVDTKKNNPVSYEVVGLKGVRTIKWGDYLLKIVRDEYGTEDALKYVISYNKFTDPNNVPVGTEVKLPRLKEK